MPNRQKFANLDGKTRENGDQAANKGAGAGAEQGGDDGGGSADGEGNAAEDGGNAGNAGNANNTGGGEAKYTDADMDAIVSKRLERERAKLERKIRASIAEETEQKQTEAEKLANMTELQRAQYEARRLKAEKEALEAERDLSRQMSIARKELSDAGIILGDELLEMFVSAEAEKTGAAIDRIKELWPKAVNDAVHAELKRTPPSAEKPPAKKSYGTSYAERYNKQKNGGTE